MQVWPGQRYPFGASYDGTGTDFAIYSESAEGDRCPAMERGGCVVLANLADENRRIGLERQPREVLLSTEPGLMLIRGSVELPAHSAAVIRY